MNNIDEAIACLSLGLGAVTLLLLIGLSKKEVEFDFLAFLFTSAIFAAIYFCLISGIHWIIKLW